MFTIPYSDLPEFMRKEDKVKPAYYIFKKDDAGNNIRVGAAFAHKKGKGLNIILNGERFVAFPPNPNANCIQE